MTGGVEYQLWIDGDPVDDDFYAMIETITVEQGIDLATEARIEIEMCMDEDGHWTGPGESYAETWKRVRLEVRNQTSTWVPLIDGPIVSWDSDASGEPGQSMMTLIAHDDTALLNRDVTYETFEDKTDADVIRAVFQADSIEKLEIDKLPEQPKDRPLKHIQRTTAIEMLRSIAEPYDLHVYVVPSDDVGRSIGRVKRLPLDGKPTLPPFILSGADRNVETFQARNEVARATRYKGRQLDIDKVAMTDVLRSKWTDKDTDPDPAQTPAPSTTAKPTPTGDPVALLGALPAIDSLAKLGTELLSPYVSAFRDITELVARWQQRASYTITANGSVRFGCYSGVLRAYDVVGVSGVPEKLCTKFIVREVTHTLSRSEYRQDFTLMTNATAKVQKGSGRVPLNVF